MQAAASQGELYETQPKSAGSQIYSQVYSELTRAENRSKTKSQPGAIGLHRQRAARPLWTLSAVWPQEVTKAVSKGIGGGGEGRGERLCKVAWHIKAKEETKVVWQTKKKKKCEEDLCILNYATSASKFEAF